MRKIELKDSKAKLSSVVDDAVRGKPSVSTRHGKREVVLLSYEEWERLSQVMGRRRMSQEYIEQRYQSWNTSLGIE